MNLADIKDMVLEQVRPLIERVMDSSLVVNLREKYDNLSPRRQKFVLIGAAVFAVLILLSYPYGYLSTASDYMMDFEDNRSTVRRLFQAYRVSQSTPNIPQPPSFQSLKSSIESEVNNLRILPDQLVGISEASLTSTLIAQNLIDYVANVQLNRLNLRQVMDVAYKAQNLSPSVKMEDLLMSADQNGYFTLAFKLVALKVPGASSVDIPDVEESKGKMDDKKGGKR